MPGWRHARQSGRDHTQQTHKHPNARTHAPALRHCGRRGGRRLVGSATANRRRNRTERRSVSRGAAGAAAVLRAAAAGRTEHPQRRVAVVGLVAGGLPAPASRSGAAVQHAATDAPRRRESPALERDRSDGSSRRGRRCEGTLEHSRATKGAGYSLGTTLMVLNKALGPLSGGSSAQCHRPSPA